jgi:hypothetical protein
VYLKKKSAQNPRDPEKTEFWSYTDAKLRSVQVKDRNINRSYMAVVNLNDGTLIRIENDNEILLTSNTAADACSKEYALVCSFKNDVFAYNGSGYNTAITGWATMHEYNWNPALISGVSLVNLQNGSRIMLQDDIHPTSVLFPYFQLSPGGHYVIYYDNDRKNYFTYAIASRTRKNITSNVRTRWTMNDASGPPGLRNTPAGLVGWLEEDTAVYIRDCYTDIWKIDPEGLRSPECVSRRTAKRNNYRMWNESPATPVLHEDDTIHLHVYDRKQSRYAEPGVADVSLHAHGDFKITQKPQLLSPPANSIRKKIINWKTFLGKKHEGLLYLPKEFDPNKKYPVIMICDEDYAGNYSSAESYDEDGGIAGYGPGYLVFFMSIRFRGDKPGRDIYHSILPAARGLKNLPYVDRKRLAIIGRGIGGYAVNYIVTRTDIFAAAISGYGATDLVSLYGAEDKNPMGMLFHGSIEVGSYRMNTDPGSHPRKYIKNSPVFAARDMNTPLLLYAVNNDIRNTDQQAVEFFKILRRIGKPVWLIKGEGNINDTHARNFLNRYLKD